MLELLRFMVEQESVGGIAPEVSQQVENLWNEYKLTTLGEGSTVLTADFGKLGSLVMKHVKTVERPVDFKYESGSYDYISIISDRMECVLWTDYENIEPYNRQSGLYCDGMSFKSLGEPVKSTPEYREFHYLNDYKSNISFAVSGFKLNSVWKSISFGICLPTEKVGEFVNKLRTIIGK